MLNKIKRWLKKPQNSTEKLAKKLGYSSGSAIRHWLNRGRIPAHMTKHVGRIVDGNSKRNK